MSRWRLKHTDVWTKLGPSTEPFRPSEEYLGPIELELKSILSDVQRLAVDAAERPRTVLTGSTGL